jgi:polar amino acid transport system permease protein
VPPLVQLLVWFNLAAIYPVVSFGIPFGPEFFSGSANDYITPFIAAVVGLGLNSAAYMCEIIRAGILSVDEGQAEAAQSLGLTHAQTMRRIVLPQAFRVIVPPTGNEVITVLKATSLVSVISMTDLLYSVELIYAKNFENIPLLVVACVWYLLITSILSVGQHFLERRLQRNSRSAGSSESLWRRILQTATSLRPGASSSSRIGARS